jgi:hypothetical protein
MKVQKAPVTDGNAIADGIERRSSCDKSQVTHSLAALLLDRDLVSRASDRQLKETNWRLRGSLLRTAQRSHGQAPTWRTACGGVMLPRAYHGLSSWVGLPFSYKSRE